MGPRAGLDAVAKRKIICPCQESKPGHPARSLVTVLTELSHLLSESVILEIMNNRNELLNCVGPNY